MTEPAEAVPQELVETLQLWSVPGVGPRLAQLLLDRFGSPGAVLAASVDRLKDVPGIGPKLAMAIAAHAVGNEGRAEWRRCRDAGVTPMLRGSTSYPDSLDQIPDPPPVLFCKGSLLPVDRLAVGIVGSRHSTAYGRQTAERLAGGLARAGITVVSGLARGIDAVAHEAALNAGGRTIAVCACGLGTIYPPEHRELAERILTHGALVTESPYLQAPVPGLFPQRNRIISGLSLGVVIVEAGRGSGALHTARHAVEQNREVFAVPGRIDSDASLGCLDLLRDGAVLVRGVDDILSELGPLATPVETGPREVVHQPQELVLSDFERMVLNLVPAEPEPVDAVLARTEVVPARILATLTVLEMRRMVQRLPGGMIMRR